MKPKPVSEVRRIAIAHGVPKEWIGRTNRDAVAFDAVNWFYTLAIMEGLKNRLEAAAEYERKALELEDEINQ